MLMSPLGAQSSFILDTEEHQEGRLTGSISMRYLVVPSFSTPEGLSGGAVATTYSRRNHPLHAPSVMANTRIGRYVRDNATGEWLILTRNESDNVTRLQWLHSSKSTTRERICLTCNTTLFNKGLFIESMLFECHDEEWRPCPQCHAPPEANCECSTSKSALALPRHPLDLPTVAAAALGEPKSEWFGRVQVSILSNYRDLRGDVDACMNLRTSFEARQEATLALQMQNLALAERAKSHIPKHLPPRLLTNGSTSNPAQPDHRSAFAHLGPGQQQRQQQSTAQQQLGLLAPSIVSTCSTTQPIRQPNGVGAPIDMLSREEKIFPLDAVVPEMNGHGTKMFGTEHHPHVGAIVMGAVTEASDQPPPHLVISNGSFDPMAMIMGKHIVPNGNHLSSVTSNGESGKGVQVVPNAPLGMMTQQQQERFNAHTAMVMDALGVNGFTSDASGQTHAKYQEPHSQSSQSSKGQNDDDEDDDDGVFDSNQERLRMPSTKSIDAFLGTFMGGAHSSTNMVAEVSPLETIDLGQGAWLGNGLQGGGISKQVSPHGTQTHSAPARRVSSGRPRNGALSDQKPVPFPVTSHVRLMYPQVHLGNGMQTQAPRPSSAPVKSGAPVTTLPIPSKHSMMNGVSMANGTMPHSGGARMHSPGGGERLLSPDSPGTDGSPPPLARLEPRPPGMSSCAEGAWLWHMGPRGPFGLAAIAAARERERRAEERRRKNREAAARSNARAKERILAIKGELEKNKDRISRLSRKRKELEAQNSALKRQLTQA